MKKVLIIIGIFVVGLIIVFTSYKFFTERNKLIYKDFSEGYGNGSGNYSITIWDSGKVKVINGNIFKRKIYYVNKKEINELKMIIDENLDKIECVPEIKYDASSTKITVYKDDKEILLDGSWNNACNENFDKINDKIIEIQKLQK